MSTLKNIAKKWAKKGFMQMPLTTTTTTKVAKATPICLQLRWWHNKKGIFLLNSNTTWQKVHIYFHSCSYYVVTCVCSSACLLDLFFLVVYKYLNCAFAISGIVYSFFSTTAGEKVFGIIGWPWEGQIMGQFWKELYPVCHCSHRCPFCQGTAPSLLKYCWR